jgi:hypothetical protein
MQWRLDHIEKPERPMKTLVNLCWLSLILPVVVNAQELGRLFFTPEQRAQMDRDSVQKPQADGNVRALELNGIVQKQGGKRTVWINGVPQQAGVSDDKTPESAPITAPGKSKSVRLKVGQRVLLSPTSNPEGTPSEAQKQNLRK